MGEEVDRRSDDDFTQDLALRLDLVNMELQSIDAILARRPALEALKHRTEKIEHACQSNSELLRVLRRICAEAESWHSVHGHGSGSTQCDSICQLIPEMQRAIRHAERKQCPVPQNLTLN